MHSTHDDAVRSERNALSQGSPVPEEQSIWLQMALGRTGSQLWSVDLRTRTLRVYASDGTAQRETVYENFPDSYLESGHVHPDSREAFRRFSLDLLSGKNADSGNFTLQYRETSCFGWVQLSYRMALDARGRPVKAIGLRTDLSYRSSGEAGFFQRRPAPGNLFPCLLGNVQANLTKDFVERLQLQGADASTLAAYGTYESVVDLCASRLFSKADEGLLRRRFGREALLGALDGGRRWVAERLRAVDAKGDIRQIYFAANMVRDSETGDVLLFAYLTDVGRIVGWEQALPGEVVRDEESGLYEMATLRAVFEATRAQAQERAAAGSCAMALVWAEGELEEDAARPADARLHRRDLATALRVALGADCALGRYRQDAVAVYFPDAASRQEIQRCVERAVSFVRLSLDDKRETRALRFVTGAVRAPRETADFDAMLDQAEALCELYGGDAEDIVVFPDAREERQRAGAGLGPSDGERIVPVPIQRGRSLTVGEKDAALACLSGMLRAATLEESANAFLACVGEHFHADRAYFLTFSEDERTIAVPYEWCAEGKYGIRQVISGKRVDRYPLLERSLDADAPQLLVRAKSLDGGLDGASPSPPAWRFAVYPLGSDDGARWTLDVENPRAIPADTALLDFLAPHVEAERARFRHGAPSAGSGESMDRLMGLPNLRAFMDGVFSFNSDQYSSMGALAMDVPDLAGLSERKGFEHGMRLILRISEVLADLFGSDLLYHTRDNEFIVLSPNTVYEVFVDRCARARMLLQTAYPNSFRMGYTWSDGSFAARTLVREAQSIMHADDTAARFADAASARSFPHDRLTEDERFDVYFQPKVDARTGLCVGAEALARVVDRTGRAVSPAGIVDAMEQDGTVKDLDYFVFDRMLDVMDGWRRHGVRLVPVSSNFSRATLLAPSSFASVLAIMSRYPSVPRSLIELEITETACSIEKATLQDIVGRFRGMGVRVGLDDFGSDYSNLAVLVNVPFDSVKIDRSLVEGLPGNDAARMVVRNIAQVCKSRRTQCVAEGVETKEQVIALIEEGCRYAQGYYYSKPIPAREFERKYLRGFETA